MADLIDRQAALDCFYGWMDKHGNAHEPDEMPEYGRIEALPSVEPERKKGKWIYPSDIAGFGRCEECNALWDVSLIENKFFRYCPRCGADMRGEQE